MDKFLKVTLSADSSIPTGDTWPRALEHFVPELAYYCITPDDGRKTPHPLLSTHGREKIRYFYY